MNTKINGIKFYHKLNFLIMIHPIGVQEKFHSKKIHNASKRCL
jgi:hypothetical protein